GRARATVPVRAAAAASRRSAPGPRSARSNCAASACVCPVVPSGDYCIAQPCWAVMPVTSSHSGRDCHDGALRYRRHDFEREDATCRQRSPRSISCSPSPSSPVSPPNLRCSAVPAGQLPFASLAKVDALYGLSAVLLVAVGLYRALHLDKGWEYYSHSVPFII